MVSLFVNTLLWGKAHDSYFAQTSGIRDGFTFSISSNISRCLGRNLPKHFTIFQVVGASQQLWLSACFSLFARRATQPSPQLVKKSSNRFQSFRYASSVSCTFHDNQHPPDCWFGLGHPNSHKKGKIFYIWQMVDINGKNNLRRDKHLRIHFKGYDLWAPRSSGGSLVGKARTKLGVLGFFPILVISVFKRSSHLALALHLFVFLLPILLLSLLVSLLLWLLLLLFAKLPFLIF